MIRSESKNGREKIRKYPDVLERLMVASTDRKIRRKSFQNAKTVEVIIYELFMDQFMDQFNMNRLIFGEMSTLFAMFLNVSNEMQFTGFFETQTENFF